MDADPQQERYVLKEKLGDGGMGEVWLATDTLLDRPVAIKYLLTPESDLHKEQFLTEGRVLARLQHPNICLIYDAVFDKDRHQFYLVMEYIPGRSLADLIEAAGSPLPLELTLEICIDVLQALDYAHRQGVVHRDIKPDNVIIHQGAAKLTDFGLANLISVLAGGTNLLAGTPEYLAPEQAEGLAVDGRADLYGLGIMLFEMVTGGHLPLEQYVTMSEILLAQVNEDPPSPRVFASGVPLSLEYVIMRLLAKAPDDRYPSAAALLPPFEALQGRHKLNQSGLILVDHEATPFVGREDGLRQMKALWEQVHQLNKSHLLVLRGEPGIGKTRLAVEFICHTIVDQGFVALVGKSSRFNLPYDPFADILATILNRDLIPTGIPPHQLEQLLTQIPDLTRLLQIPLPPKSVQPYHADQVQWQFLAAVLSIFSQLGPVVIFLENATELDEASYDLLQFLLSREQLPLLVVAACRDPEQAAWHKEVTIEKTEIELEPLSAPLVETYLNEWVGTILPRSTVDSIQQHSRGNPQRLEEATQQLIEAQKLYQDEAGQWHFRPTQPEVPKTGALLARLGENALAGRLRRLTDESRDGLRLAALLEDGPEFDFDIWLALLGGESKLTFAHRILNEALEERLIRQIDEYRYAFRSMDVTKLLVSDLPDEEQRSWHLTIADKLDEVNASPILVSYHYEQAGLVNEAARLLQTAGDEAFAGYGLNTAIAYYNRAVQLVQTRSVHKKLGKLFQYIGQGQPAIDNYHQALTLAQQAGDTVDQANILNRMSQALWLLQDRYKEAYQRAASVLSLPGAPDTERAVAQSNLGMISWYMGHLQEAEEWCQKAVAALEKEGDEACLATAYNRLGLAYLSLGKLSDAEKSFQASLAIREKLNDNWGQAFCLNNLGKVATERGDFEQALSLLESARHIFERIDSLDGQMVTHTNIGRLMLYQGSSEKALPWLTKALHLARQVGKQTAYGLSEIYLLVAQASSQGGDVKRAQAAASDALKIVEAVGNPEYVAIAHAVQAQIYKSQGNQAEAATAFRRALTLFKQVGSLTGLLRTQLEYAQFLRQTGETAAAISLEQETRVEAERIGLYLPPDTAVEQSVAA